MSAIAFEYPEDVRAIRDGIESFLRAEVLPRHERHADVLENEHSKYDPDGRYSGTVLRLLGEIRQASARAGYYNMCVPETLGGLGLGHLAWFGAWERIGSVCQGRYWMGEAMIAHWATGPSPVLGRLTQQARETVLPAMMRGETTMCFGMSEPGAGSDAAMMTTRAERHGDGWRINGSKIWTTNSPYADHCIVFAITNPQLAAGGRGAGISAFLVPTRSPGFHVQKVIRMWGHAGGNEAVLSFDDVEVGPSQLVGDLDKGFAIAMLGVNLGRIYNSARAIAQARWALETAFEYAKIRKTFGKPIADYQGVTFPLAESAMDVHAAHLMALNACQLLDQGQAARKELSMTKAFTMQACTKALDRVIQAHGAIGVTNEMYLAQTYLNLRLANIADGSNEILRRTIVKEMLTGDTDL